MRGVSGGEFSVDRVHGMAGGEDHHPLGAGDRGPPVGQGLCSKTSSATLGGIGETGIPPSESSRGKTGG